MELTDERFRAIIEALRSDSRTGNKRLHPRVGVSCTVRLIPVDNEQPLLPKEARVRDIAKTGIGLVLFQRLRMGRQLIVQIPAVEGPSMLLLCRVCHCQQSQDVHTIGLGFVKQGYAEIHAPPAPQQPASAAEEDPAVRRIRDAILDTGHSRMAPSVI